MANVRAAGERQNALFLSQHNSIFFGGIEAGACLPKRSHNGMCEVFVVRGKGQFSDGRAFEKGDYAGEEDGTCDKISANSELVVFFTHHGTGRFLDEDESVLLEMDHMYTAE